MSFVCGGRDDGDDCGYGCGCDEHDAASDGASDDGCGASGGRCVTWNMRSGAADVVAALDALAP